MVLKVHKKGIVVLPKALREEVGVEEGDELVAEVLGEAIVLRPLKPRVLDVDAGKVREVIEEERRKWDRRLDVFAGEAGT